MSVPIPAALSSGTPLFIVDAFADGPFTGNPAAVCLLQRGGSLSGWPDAAWMQRVADEMNLSETAFVLPPDPAQPNVRTIGLRWFTPKAEVELCGHATLASAHVLFYEFGKTVLNAEFLRVEDQIQFETRYAGILRCERAGQNVLMDFPAQRCRPAEPPSELFSALGLHVDQVSAVNYGPYDFIVEAKSPAAVIALRPSFTDLAAIEARGVAVTAAIPPDHAEAKHRFRNAQIVSRFFAPSLRIAEDPVTGSLHCVLATYWASRIGQQFVAYQASDRGGLIKVELKHPMTGPIDVASGGGEGRVSLSGKAITVLRGQLAPPCGPGSTKK